MAPRPNWKGYLKLSLVSCSISLYPATSDRERVSFNQIHVKCNSRIRYTIMCQLAGTFPTGLLLRILLSFMSQIVVAPPSLCRRMSVF